MTPDASQVTTILAILFYGFPLCWLAGETLRRRRP